MGFTTGGKYAMMGTQKWDLLGCEIDSFGHVWLTSDISKNQVRFEIPDFSKASPYNKLGYINQNLFYDSNPDNFVWMKDFDATVNNSAPAELQFSWQKAGPVYSSIGTFRPKGTSSLSMKFNGKELALEENSSSEDFKVSSRLSYRRYKSFGLGLVKQNFAKEINNDLNSPLPTPPTDELLIEFAAPTSKSANEENFVMTNTSGTDVIYFQNMRIIPKNLNNGTDFRDPKSRAVIIDFVKTAANGVAAKKGSLYGIGEVTSMREVYEDPSISQS